MRYPYNLPTSIKFEQNVVDQAWSEWKQGQISATKAGPAPRLRVLGGVDFNSTVSEGQGYGILLASIFDDQQTLDGLWLFAADHLDQQKLMNWHIGDYKQMIGTGAATDGDEDMAMGMVNACFKTRRTAWPASANNLDYCAIASTLINAIWRYEVDQPGAGNGLSSNKGFELLPGDQWNIAGEYPAGIVNLSYFAPAYYRVFANFTGNADWLKVVDRNYELAKQAQDKSGNCSKLVSNWDTYAGDPQTVSWQGEASAFWGWDAARFAWRIAVDQAWFGDANASDSSNTLASFFASVGFDNLKGQYKLDGTPADDNRGAFFTANAAAAIWAAPAAQGISCGQASGSLKTTAQQAFDAVVATKEPGPASNSTYYSNAWRLFTLLLLSGNFPNMASGQ